MKFSYNSLDKLIFCLSQVSLVKRPPELKINCDEMSLQISEMTTAFSPRGSAMSSRIRI